MKKFVKPSNRPRVALLVESSRAYGRGILSGVAKFVREHDPWSIFFQDLNLCDDTPEWLKNWHGEGIISRLENRDVVGVIHRLKVPVVYLRHDTADLIHALGGRLTWTSPLPGTADLSINNPAIAH